MEKSRSAVLKLVITAAVIMVIAVIAVLVAIGKSEDTPVAAAEEKAALAGNIQLLIFERDLAAARARGMVFSNDGRTLLTCTDKKITEAVIPPCVSAIGTGAFANCGKLYKVDIPASVNVIGDGAFMNCRSLHAVSIPENVNTIGTGAFADCRNLRDVTIPAGVENIGSWAFANCWNLETLNIPKTLELAKVGNIPPGCAVKQK